MDYEPDQDPIKRLADLNRRLADIEVDPTMFGRILDALPDGLIVISEDGTIRLVNVQIELMFGYHRSRLIGASVHMLLPDALAVNHIEHLRKFFESPTTRAMHQARTLNGRHSTGRPIMVQVMISPLVAEEGVFGLALVRRVAGE